MSNLIDLPRMFRRQDARILEATPIQPMRLVNDLEDKAQAVERTRDAMQTAIHAHNEAVAAFQAELKERKLCPKLLTCSASKPVE